MCEPCGCKPLARSRVYQFLALGFGYPDPSLPALLRQHRALAEASLESLREKEGLEAVRALAPALNALTEADLEGSYVQCFGHTISKECPPYEAEYGQAHIFQKSQALADIAGFYAAFGLEPAPDLQDRLDHISVELEFMHFLCVKEAYALAKGHPAEQLALCREAQRKFLGEHLGRWAVAFTSRLEERAPEGVHRPVARVLAAFMTGEMRALGHEPGKAVGPAFAPAPDEGTPGCEACPVLAPAGGGGES